MRAAPLLLVLLLSAPSPAQDQRLVELPGLVREDLELRGRYRLSRDLTVFAGATLTIAPGTVIEVAPADGQNGGFNRKLCEIVVEGRLRAVGTAESPVRIIGGKPRDELGESLESGGWKWLGIVLRSDRSRAPDSVLRHVRISNAFAGVQVAAGSPRIERCVFEGCGTGVSAGHTYIDGRGIIERAAGAEPVITECLFLRCSTGVFAESNGSPEVRRSTFLGCRVGAGNSRPGFSYPVWHLGQRVHRCLFAENRTAVVGPSVVTDCLFLKNEEALALSGFHTDHSSLVDRLAWRGNVLHENSRLSSGESDFGIENLLVDPRVVGLPSLADAGEPEALPSRLGFAPDSPVLGRATDGGDPGPTGRKGAGRDARTWRSGDAALHRALVLGPPSAVPASVIPPTGGAAPQPGDVVGDAWWVVVPTGESGGIEAAALVAGVPSELTVLFPFELTAAQAQSAQLELNVDGVVAARTDAGVLELPNSSQRFGGRGTLVPLAGGAGPRWLHVRWRPADVLPRLGVALHVPGGGAVADGIDDPPAKPPRVSALNVRGRWVGFAFDVPVSWVDLRRPDSVTVLDADGRRFDLSELATHLSAGGRVKAQVPPEFRLPATAIVVRDLRDAWGRSHYPRATTLLLEE